MRCLNADNFYYHQSNLWLMCLNMCSHYSTFIYPVKSSALILEAIIICLFALTLLFIHILLILVPLSSSFLSLCFSYCISSFVHFLSLSVFPCVFPYPFMTLKYKFNTKYIHFSSQRSFQQKYRIQKCSS